MSGITERTLIQGTIRLSGKRERYVPFPWEIVSAGGVVWGWEPAEYLPMGASKKPGYPMTKSLDVLPSNYEVRDYHAPYFYDDSNGINQRTLLHGGHVQEV